MKYIDFLKLIHNNALSGAYLLHGEDEFFKQAAEKAASSLISEELSVFNLSVLRDADLDSIASRCETVPMMSDISLVIVKGLAGNIDSGALIDYIAGMPASTVLLIVIKGKLEAGNKLVKEFAKSGREVLFSEPTEYDAMRWCLKQAVRRGAALDESTARTFIGLVGTDMSFVSNELNKLIDLAGPGGVITPELVSRSAITSVETEVFDAINCFTAGKVKDGMRALHVLLDREKDASRIIGALLSNFKRMLEGRILMDKGLSAKSAAAKMEGKPYPNEKACNAAKKYTRSSLGRLVGELSLVIYNQRSANIDAATAIENIMLAFDW